MDSLWARRVISQLTVRSGFDSYLLRLRDFSQRHKEDRRHSEIARTGEVSLPVSLTLALTMRCNLRCFMCYQTEYREEKRGKLSKKELSAEDWSDFLKKSRPFIKRVGLTGGEPFIRSDIFEILDSLEKLEIPFNILTNGVLVDEKKASRLAFYKFLDTLCFSVHGFQKTYDEIVGSRGSFEKVARAIKLVSKKHFWVAVNCTISKKNLNELFRLVNFSASHGVDSIGFQLENFATPKEERISRQSLNKKTSSGFVQSKKESVYPYSFSALMKAWYLARRAGREKGIPVTFTPYSFCSDPESVYLGNARESGFDFFCEDLINCRIDPEGNVIACQFLPQRFGNVKKQSLKKIWFSPQFKTYRKRLLSNNLLQICNRCCKIRRIS